MVALRSFNRAFGESDGAMQHNTFSGCETEEIT
jgi:hypothetical protein